jgi:hypothetical protein
MWGKAGENTLSQNLGLAGLLYHDVQLALVSGDMGPTDLSWAVLANCNEWY